MLSLTRKVITTTERQLVKLARKHIPVSTATVQKPLQCSRAIHSSAVVQADYDKDENPPMGRFKVPKKKWFRYNDIVYPPQLPGEPRRPADVCHGRMDIKYSKDKLWYTAGMIRGMTIDEAMKQLTFSPHKGAHIILEVLKEAQQIAVEDHNVEFRYNLWIEESFVNKAKKMKAMGGSKVITVNSCHYYVRISEGKPPKHYFEPVKTGYQQMEEYIKSQRARKIKWSL
ncbi:39S ribosomal protein L22, mitochondrial-like isoform X2 [Mizuhopecten yessoensis]|uniref:39S ribosomal protein L22, mitochondrial-like isoform X2 n=1 Tax=Mizuhopecten yessoensis TaxID=6573 RepID=UPI000B45B7F9|nr:39S ribosomal protein L22, mitochondrial-like isoform X2 [Mizuhopecten yessoensis]